MENGGGQNPIVLALIGAPFLFGCYWRFKTYSFKKLEDNVQYTSIIYLLVAIGYSFQNFSRPHAFFVNYSTHILYASLFLMLGYGSIESLKEADRGERGCGCIAVPIALAAIPITYAIFFLPLTAFVSYFGNLYIVPISVIVVFVLFGIANSALGTIAAGFSLSATAASYFSHGNLDFIYIWKDIFDFFEISNLYLKILMIFMTCILGSSELISIFVSRLKE